ncbi:adhesion G-protein coupled receptor G6-like isoform X1 [Branchiostoma floridae x Branchiostoma belcheri]
MTPSTMPRSLRISTVYLLLGMLLLMRVGVSDAVDACDVCDCSDPTNIDCQDLELTEVPTNFPREAQSVILSNNRISRVPLNAFVDLGDLVFLYLHSNALTNLEEGTFDNIPNLIEVYMRDNPFQCDCNLQWLASWVQDGSGRDILKDNPQCLSPDSLNGQSLTSVNVWDMVCPTTTPPPVTEATTEAPATPALATWCPEEESVLVSWPRTYIDTQARVACPEGDGTAIRDCVWMFGEGASWGTPNMTTCFSNRVTQRLSELAYLPPERVLDSIDELQTWTSWSDQFTLVDTVLAAKTLSSISAAQSLDTQQCSTTLQCISNLMQADEQLLLEAQRMYNSVSMLMSVMEPVTFNTMFDGDTFVTTAGDIAIGLGVFQTVRFPGAAFVKQSTDDRRSYQSDQEFEIFLNDVSSEDLGGFSSIKLPTTLLDRVILSEPPTVQFTFYRSGRMFDLVSQADGNSSFSMMKLQVPIISATVGGMHVSNLYDRVQINFRRLTTGTPICVFWDTSANDWSREGCRLASDQHDIITCECNHLTNFAVLMDIYGNIDNISDADLTALMIISYVGCAISMFGIAATLLTYSLFRKLRRDNPTKILMNLCLALLLAILFFVCSGPAHNSGSRGACVTVAVLLHYFLLTSMAWMGLEALNLYLAIMKVFNTYYRHFMLKFCIAGWGSPAVIVAITLAVNVENYTQYGGICWLQPNAFYGAFLAPVCLVLLLNCVMFGLVIRQLVGGAANEFKKADKVETTTKLRGAIGLVILLGLTWVLAIFAIAEASLTFSYLFAIVNSLQGMFIFVFHCVLKKDVQNHWMTILPCGPKGRPGTPGSAWTGSKSMSTPSQLHRSSRVSDINIKAFHAMTIEDADDFNSIGQGGSDNADDVSDSGSRPTTASGIRLDTSFRTVDFQAYTHPPITDYCNPPSPIPEASRECSDESTSVYDIETINDISEA